MHVIPSYVCDKVVKLGCNKYFLFNKYLRARLDTNSCSLLKTLTYYPASWWGRLARNLQERQVYGVCTLCLVSLIHPSSRKFEIQDSYVDANSIAKAYLYQGLHYHKPSTATNELNRERDIYIYIYINIQGLPTAPTYPAERNHSLSLSRRPGEFSFLPVSFPVPGLSFIVKTHLHIQEGREKQGELS